MNRKSFLRNAVMSAFALSLPKLLMAAEYKSGDNYIMEDFMFYSKNGVTTGKVIFQENGNGKWKAIRDYTYDNKHKTELIS